jgi:hypothetical protein
MAKSDNSAKMPSHVDERLRCLIVRHLHQRASVQGVVLRGCALLVLIWVPTFWLRGLDGWALVINTFTSTITFLLVATAEH